MSTNWFHPGQPPVYASLFFRGSDSSRWARNLSLLLAHKQQWLKEWVRIVQWCSRCRLKKKVYCRIVFLGKSKPPWPKQTSHTWGGCEIGQNVSCQDQFGLREFKGSRQAAATLEFLTMCCMLVSFNFQSNSKKNVIWSTCKQFQHDVIVSGIFVMIRLNEFFMFDDYTWQMIHFSF